MKALKRMSSAFGYSEIEPETDLVEPFAETEDEYVNEDDSTDYYDDQSSRTGNQTPIWLVL